MSLTHGAVGWFAMWHFLVILNFFLFYFKMAIQLLVLGGNSVVAFYIQLYAGV